MFSHFDFVLIVLILEYICQKLKKHTHFKISFWDEVFARLFFFFFITGWNFIPVYLIGMSSSWDEISYGKKRLNSKRDREDFNPGWNFARKHPLNLHHLSSGECFSEATIGCILQKKVLLKISWNSQENACVEVCF